MADLFSMLADHFKGLEQILNQLDAAVGDGDHGSTICKGLAAAAQSDEPVKTFRRSAGGASGSLFAVLLAALQKASEDPDCLAGQLEEAARKIGHLGGAVAGDKTMLDALLPAASAAAGGESVLAAARAGAASTVAMAARRGRARYVEGAGVGHLDAGAQSVVEMLDIYEKWSGQQ